MSGNFDDFKKEIIEGIQRVLIQEYVTDEVLKKSNKTVIVCYVNNEEIIYQLNPQLCQRVTDKVDLTKPTIDTCLINMRNKQPKLQANMVELLATIEKAECGYNLWEDVKKQIDKMPSTWFFIERKLTVKNCLKSVLAKNQQTKLKAYDDISFKEKLQSLLVEIQTLLDKIAKLLQENNLLKIELFDLRNTVNQREQLAIERNKLLETQLEAIRLENTKLIEAYHLTVKSKNSYEEECEMLTVENTRLLDLLEQKITELEQSRLAFSHADNNANSHRTSIPVRPSAESSTSLMKRFNNEHRKRRSTKNPSSIWIRTQNIQTTMDSDENTNYARRANNFDGA